MGVAELHTRLHTPLIASAPLSALRAPLWLPCMHPEMAWELRCPMPCFCLTNTDLIHRTVGFLSASHTHLPARGREQSWMTMWHPRLQWLRLEPEVSSWIAD